MSIRDLLKSVEINELLDFLVGYAKHNRKLADALKQRFSALEAGALDFGYEVGLIAKMVDKALPKNIKTRNEICYIDFDSTKIDQKISFHLSQGYIRLAFAELEVIYRKLLDVFEIQDECEISDVVENYIDLMAEVAKNAVDASDQEYIFDRCIILCRLDTAKDYGADYEEMFLRIASQFITRENKGQFDAELSKLNNRFLSDDFKLIELNMIRRLEGDKAAEPYIGQNLESNSIRTVAYDMAMAREDYNKAEELCLFEPNGSNGYQKSVWQEKLLAIYERTGKKDKQAEICEKLLLEDRMKYFNNLKTLLTQLGRWEAEYQTLLEKCEKQMTPFSFMKILDQEKEYKGLMAQILKHPEQVFTYGKKLSTSYFDEVGQLFASQLNAQSSKVKNRQQYEMLSSRIRTFAEAGYALQANTLVYEYKRTFKHKPVFIDELNKLGTF
jgi:hypothetical protein